MYRDVPEKGGRRSGRPAARRQTPRRGRTVGNRGWCGFVAWHTLPASGGGPEMTYGTKARIAPRPRVALAVTAAAVVLVAVGCGGGDDSNTSSGGAKSSAPPASTRPVKRQDTPVTDY